MRTRLIAVLVLSAVFPALAVADPFSEFRVPDHSWASGTVRAGMAGNWSAVSDQVVERRQNAFQAQLRPSLLFARDAEPLQHSLLIDLAGLANVLDEDEIVRSGAYGAYSPYQNSHTQGTAESWRLNGSLRVYPWTTPVGLGVSGQAAGAYQQTWSRMDRSYVPPLWATNEREDVHRYAYDVRLAVSAGLGRVRDATVIHDVHVLEQRLRETGAISRPLSRRAREGLAALYYVAPYYGFAHDRPGRYVWREMERVLREDGALGEDGLDAYSVLRAMEPSLYRVTRLRGWFLGPVVEATHQHAVERFDNYISTSSFDELGDLVSYWSSATARHFLTSYDQVNAGALAQFGCPVGWRWQFDARSQVTAPVRPGERGLNATSNAAVTWLVADRWEAQAFVSHARQWFAPRDDRPLLDDSWDVGAGAELGWYLEDRVRLSASIVQSQRRDYSYWTYPGWERTRRTYARDTRFLLGISYRFLGSLDAPGLVAPVRSIH